MLRKETWPELLNAYLDSVRREPFVWGKFDCCMFAADGVLAMTGVDPAEEFRGSYDDAASAYQSLQRFAGGGILATVEKLAKQFVWTEVGPRHIQRGDIVMGNPDVIVQDVRLDGSLGLCAGTISIFVGDDGLLGVSTLEMPGAPPNIIRAWRIGVGRD